VPGRHGASFPAPQHATVMPHTLIYLYKMQDNARHRTVSGAIKPLMNTFIRQRAEDRQDNYRLQTEIKKVRFEEKPSPSA